MLKLKAKCPKNLNNFSPLMLLLNFLPQLDIDWQFYNEASPYT